MKEDEIRPQALLNRYLELSARDAETCFGGESRVALPCVACGGHACNQSPSACLGKTHLPASLLGQDDRT